MEEKPYYFNYERSYGPSGADFIPSYSLIDFYHKEVERRLRPEGEEKLSILELGCGQGSLFSGLVDEQMKVLGVDLSSCAIDLAQKNERKKNLISYLCADACSLKLTETFDLIYDAHLLHCLCTPEHRLAYLQNVGKLLKGQGFFALETMVFHKRMDFDEAYYYHDGEGVLYKEVGDNSFHGVRTFYGKRFVPARSIRRSHEIEEELSAAGLRIVYFQILSGFKVIPDERRIQALDGDPDLLRVICQPKVLSQM